MDKIRLQKQQDETFVRLYGDTERDSTKVEVEVFNDALMKRNTFRARKSITSPDQVPARFYSSTNKERAFTPWDASVGKSDIKSTWESN